jgi:hypothetical protein
VPIWSKVGKTLAARRRRKRKNEWAISSVLPLFWRCGRHSVEEVELKFGRTKTGRLVEDSLARWGGASSRAVKGGVEPPHSTTELMPGLLGEEILAQGDHVVVFLIFGTEEQRHFPFARVLSNFGRCVWICVQFLEVPFLEDLPLLGIVTEPLAKLGAGRHLAQPKIEF